MFVPGFVGSEASGLAPHWLHGTLKMRGLYHVQPGPLPPPQEQEQKQEQEQALSLQHLTPVQISQQRQCLQQQQQQQHELRQPGVAVQHAEQPQLQAASLQPRRPPTLQQWTARAAVSPTEARAAPPVQEAPGGSLEDRPRAGRRVHCKRPDPAAAQAAAMGPVGDRRHRKPRKLLYGEWRMADCAPP